MIDRETVIAGLRLLKETYGFYASMRRTIDDAIALLQDEPADAVREGLHYVCGNCLKMLPPLSVFCPQCGRRLKYD